MLSHPLTRPLTQFLGRALTSISGVALPSMSELIAWFKGPTDTDEVTLLNYSGNHSGQVKGTSVEGDGSGIGTLSSTVTLVGDFTLTATVGLNVANQYILYEPGAGADYLRFDGTNWVGNINGAANGFLTVTNIAGVLSYSRVGSVVTLSVGNQSEAVSFSSADVIIKGLGGSTVEIDGNLYDLKATDSTGLKLDLAMNCLGSTTEHSATAGLPDCVWSGFSSDPIVEHTDGTGYDSNVLGFGTDSSGNRTPYGHATATTNYPGPIAPDMDAVRMGCIEGDGTGYVAITGLLTSDTISVETGSDTPTCTVNDKLAITSGEQIWGVTITRSGSIWAYYSCLNGHPVHNANETMVEDIVGGNHGTATSFIGDAYGERDTGEYLLLEGMSVDREIDTELMNDPNFESWSGSSFDDWFEFAGASPAQELFDAGNYVTYNNGCQIVADGNLAYSGIKQDTTSLGSIYVEATIIVSAITGVARLTNNAGTVGTISTIGTHNFFLDADIETRIGNQYSDTLNMVITSFLVKQVITGYNAVQSDGTHQDGTLPYYKPNTWALAKVLPCNFRGGFGPLTQLVTPQFIDEGDIRICDEPQVGENDKVYWGNNGLVYYSAEQSANEAKILSVLDGDSAAEELGPELAVNHTFLTDTVWTKGTGWTIASHKATSDGSQAAVSDLSQDVLTDAIVYQVEFELSGVSAGSVTAFAGSDSGTARTANGRYIETLTCTADTVLDLQASADFVGSIEFASCREVIGNGPCTITTGSV